MFFGYNDEVLQNIGGSQWIETVHLFKQSLYISFPLPPHSFSPFHSCLCVRSLDDPTIASTDMKWVLSHHLFMALILFSVKNMYPKKSRAIGMIQNQVWTTRLFSTLYNVMRSQEYVCIFHQPYFINLLYRALR